LKKAVVVRLSFPATPLLSLSCSVENKFFIGITYPISTIIVLSLGLNSLINVATCVLLEQ
jgi:hypothetical protein